MDLRGNMAPELKDVQNGCSWIPTTPAKLDSTTQQPICSGGKDKDIVDIRQLDPERYSGFKQDNHTNWFETGRLLNNLQQETQCLAIPTCYKLTNSVNVHLISNTLQANQHTNSQVHEEDLCINDKFTINNNIWNNLSFGNLLAVAHAHSSPGAKSNVELNSLPQTLTGESSISTMTMCNFHSPTRTNTNSTTVKSVLSPFEPLTPEKLGKEGCESVKTRKTFPKPFASCKDVFTAG